MGGVGVAIKGGVEATYLKNNMKNKKDAITTHVEIEDKVAYN